LRIEKGDDKKIVISLFADFYEIYDLTEI